MAEKILTNREMQETMNEHTRGVDGAFEKLTTCERHTFTTVETHYKNYCDSKSIGAEHNLLATIRVYQVVRENREGASDLFGKQGYIPNRPLTECLPKIISNDCVNDLGIINPTASNLNNSIALNSALGSITQLEIIRFRDKISDIEFKLNNVNLNEEERLKEITNLNDYKETMQGLITTNNTCSKKGTIATAAMRKLYFDKKYIEADAEAFRQNLSTELPGDICRSRSYPSFLNDHVKSPPPIVGEVSDDGRNIEPTTRSNDLEVIKFHEGIKTKLFTAGDPGEPSHIAKNSYIVQALLNGEVVAQTACNTTPMKPGDVLLAENKTYRNANVFRKDGKYGDITFHHVEAKKVNPSDLKNPFNIQD